MATWRYWHGSNRELFAVLQRAVLSISIIVAATTAASADASQAAPNSKLDLYVLANGWSGTQPCAIAGPDQADHVRSAIADMVHHNLPKYAVAVKRAATIDILTPYFLAYPQAPALPAPPSKPIDASLIQIYPPSDEYAPNVLIATYCKAGDVFSITLTGYNFRPSDVSAQAPLSGSLSGTFDGLETANWANIFGAVPLFPTVAFLPVPNDTTNVINPRLLRNLPLTVIATPPPAPAAPASPPAPAPPTTRLAACQASAYRILITGRTATASQTTDLIRLIVAGASLKFSGPQPWPTIWTVLGAALGVTYIPDKAEVGADVFICPKNYVPPNWDKPMPDAFLWVGGYNSHIVGHRTSSAIAVDLFHQQRTLDTAIVDLENQLDCIIDHKLDEMGIVDLAGNPVMNDKFNGDPLVLGTDPEAKNRTWCSDYITKLERKGTTGDQDVPAAPPYPHIYSHGDLLLNYHPESNPNTPRTPPINSLK